MSGAPTCRIAPGGRGVRGRHPERLGVRVPPRQRRVEPVLHLPPHVQERGRAGPPVEVLVGAADRQVDAVLVQPDRQRARAVAQVPHGVRPGRAGGGGERGQVVQPAGAVVDVVEQHGGGALADRGRHLGGRHGTQRPAGEPGRRPGEVPVGGEGGGVDQDLVPPLARHPHGGDQRLEDVHAGGVADHDLPGAGADQRGDPVADPLRRGPPAALLPGADAQLAPLPADHVLDPSGHVRGQRAQRVAVQVDHVVQDEPGPHGGQRVGRVQLRRGTHQLRHTTAPSTARGRRSCGPASPARPPRRSRRCRSWRPSRGGWRPGGRCASATPARRHW
ncbi:hypothetical protein SFUMM280S_03368 [Streptomyces fumanus]